MTRPLRIQYAGAVYHQSSAGQIQGYRLPDRILGMIERKTGKDLNALKEEKGDLRRMAMELLYRCGGMKGPEIGALFGLT